MADTTNPAGAQSDYPNLDPYGNSNGNASSQAEHAKNKAVESKNSLSILTLITPPQYSNPTPLGANSAMNSISNSETVKSLQNGPMADKARAEAAQTQSEFSNLAASRQTPSSTTATGQNLTHYHSMFYNLLSWENPRATSISFATTIIFIFATRYVPIIRYALKALYMILGITAAAEIAGKAVMGKGLATSMRPKRYYTIPRESLEAMLEDVEQLINFFVIEFQRIIFAENVYVTIAAFTTALIGYFLVKFVPKWGLALIGTTVVYLAPLIYIKNQALIDSHLENAGNIMSKQTEQMRSIASQQTNKAMEVTSSATKQYAAKAQEMMGGAKKAAVEKGYVSKETAEKAPGQPIDSVGEKAPVGGVQHDDFPSAPKTEPAPESTELKSEEPLAS